MTPTQEQLIDFVAQRFIETREAVPIRDAAKHFGVTNSVIATVVNATPWQLDQTDVDVGTQRVVFVGALLPDRRVLVDMINALRAK